MKFTAVFLLPLFLCVRIDGFVVVPSRTSCGKSRKLSTHPGGLSSMHQMDAVSPSSSMTMQKIHGEDEDEDYVIDSIADLVTEDIVHGSYDSKDPLCTDTSKLNKAKQALRSRIGSIVRAVRGDLDDDDKAIKSSLEDVLGEEVVGEEEEAMGELSGEKLLLRWENRANSSKLARTAEIWGFALRSTIMVNKFRKLREEDKSEEKVERAKTAAGVYIRDGLLKLGPTFIKLGQVAATREDVFPKELCEILQTLQADVPGFSTARAKSIIQEELGRPCDSVFEDFSPHPLAAASLGQVHTAYYKGKKVAIKVQRAGLKNLIDADMKSLKTLSEFLNNFDPKTDGTDRDWVAVYEESKRILYEEIDYLHEASNTKRFAADFADTDWVRVPHVYEDVTTQRVLTMEFVTAFKLTDLERVDFLGLNRTLLSERVANSFLRQIIETGYFHCDPHPGNLCCDDDGNLVYFDYGMMDELRPSVRSGVGKMCRAVFAGPPMIDDLELARNAKLFVDGAEDAGIIAKGADRLAIEKFGRYFIRSFKDAQLGKKQKSAKEAVGADLQTLTDNNAFRFPSTLTFVTRAIASIEGIGKGLDPDFNLGKLAKPFVQEWMEGESDELYSSKLQKNMAMFGKATGLNEEGIKMAITSPKKIAYIASTLKSMEEGTLKIRVRSLENEKALERVSLTQGRTENMLLSCFMLLVGGFASGPYVKYVRAVGRLGSALFAFRALLATKDIKNFDDKQAKFDRASFGDDG